MTLSLSISRQRLGYRFLNIFHMINIHKMPVVKTSCGRCGEDGDEEETLICGKERRENFCKKTLDDARSLV